MKIFQITVDDPLLLLLTKGLQLGSNLVTYYVATIVDGNIALLEGL